MLLLEGTDAAGEGDREVKRERVREGMILLLPLKLPDFGGASPRRSVSGSNSGSGSNISSGSVSGRSSNIGSYGSGNGRSNRGNKSSGRSVSGNA